MSKKNYSWLNLSYLNKSYKGLPFLHPKNLKDLYPVHKQRKDRAFKSWCNRDIWNFDGWFQQVIPEMLEELAKTHVSYPMIDFDKTRQTGKREYRDWRELTREKFNSDEEYKAAEEAQCKAWEDYLKEIATHIRNSTEETCPKKNSVLEKYDGWANKIPEEEKEQYYQEDAEIDKYRQSEIEKALDMMKPIFFDLWD